MPNRSHIWHALLVLAAPSLCAPHNSTDATLWMQTSAEYRLLVEQVFRQAQWRLPRLLAAPSVAGAVENQADAGSKQPAVVLDIDETVLDNGPWEALAIVRDQESFDPDSWNLWVMSHKADALPGAREYVLTARRLGVEVFYVTNRSCDSPEICPQQDATIKNLAALDFPDVEDARVMLRNEEPDWTSDKSSRRAEIAKEFRIVQIIGDDLGDFIPGARGSSPQQRLDMAAQYRTRFGHTWYLLPNPRYGSWKKALGVSPVSHLQPDRELLCLGSQIPIDQLQGPGPGSFCTGLTVTTRGVVTRLSSGDEGLGGFFIQPPRGENDPATNKDIFVLDSNNQNEVEAGDYVEIHGKVTERNGLVVLDPMTPKAAAQQDQVSNPKPTADEIR